MYYKRRQDLSSGVYGQVYKGEICQSSKYKATQFSAFRNSQAEIVAIKVMKSELVYRRELLWYKVLWLNEVKANAYIGRLYGYDSPRKSLIFEFGLSLRASLENATLELKYKWMSQLIQGLKYIHDQGLLHMDIKLDNILIFSGEAKYIDLGLARIRGWYREFPDKIYPLSYRAPEILHAQLNAPTIKIRVGRCVEFWALGVVCFFILEGSNPFAIKTSTLAERFQHVIKTHPTLKTDRSILKLLTFNPTTRQSSFPSIPTIELQDTLAYSCVPNTSFLVWYKWYLKSNNIYSRIRYIDGIWHWSCLQSHLDSHVDVDQKLLVLTAAQIIALVYEDHRLIFSELSSDDQNKIQCYRHLYFELLGAKLYTESLFRYLKYHLQHDKLVENQIFKFIDLTLSRPHASKAKLYSALLSHHHQ